MDKQEYDENQIGDLIEYQTNQFNPGYYVGTGKVPPAVRADGNALPVAIEHLVGTIALIAFHIFLMVSDVNITPKIGGSELATKIIASIIFLAMELFFARLSFVYFKKAVRYYKRKKEMDAEALDQDQEQDEIIQRLCPGCGKRHDIDYPKCPYCKHNYLD